MYPMDQFCTLLSKGITYLTCTLCISTVHTLFSKGITCLYRHVKHTGGIIIGIELWYDDLYNEPAVCPYTNLFPSGGYWIIWFRLMSAAYFSGCFRHVNVLQQHIWWRKSSEGLFSWAFIVYNTIIIIHFIETRLQNIQLAQ